VQDHPPIADIEQEWNANQERWRFVAYDTGLTDEMLKGSSTRWKEWLARPSQLKEEDTDWKRWLLGKSYRPVDPHVYLEFRLYKDFSSGIFDQWMTHGCDLLHLWTGETYPESVVANGGVFTWKDGRENPDTIVAAITYPKGFLYTYKVTFGNSFRSFARSWAATEQSRIMEERAPLCLLSARKAAATKARERSTRRASLS